MFTHIPTGHKFNSRLEAKRIMGTSRYNKALKNREFTLHCNDADLKIDILQDNK